MSVVLADKELFIGKPMDNVSAKFWISPTFKYQTGDARRVVQRYLHSIAKEIDNHVICDAHLDLQSQRMRFSGEIAPDLHLVIGFENDDLQNVSKEMLRIKWFNLTGNSIIKIGDYDDM